MLQSIWIFAQLLWSKNLAQGQRFSHNVYPLTWSTVVPFYHLFLEWDIVWLIGIDFELFLQLYRRSHRCEFATKALFCLPQKFFKRFLRGNWRQIKYSNLWLFKRYSAALMFLIVMTTKALTVTFSLFFCLKSVILSFTTRSGCT